MEIGAVKLRLPTGALVAVADDSQIARDAIAALSDGPPDASGYAGQGEIPMILGYLPHLVDMTRAPGGFLSGIVPR